MKDWRRINDQAPFSVDMKVKKGQKKVGKLLNSIHFCRQIPKKLIKAETISFYNN